MKFFALILFAFSGPSFAQTQNPVIELIKEVSRRTGYRVACGRSDFEGGSVSLSECVQGLEKLLKSADDIRGRSFTKIFVSRTNINAGASHLDLFDVAINFRDSIDTIVDHLQAQP